MATLQAPIKDHKISTPWNAKGPAWSDLGYEGHNGDDYAAPHGTPVYAAAAGTVVFAGDGRNHGWMAAPSGICVLIRHDDRHTDYCHLSKYAVATGSRVKAGQLIGYVGATGSASGPHLHFSQLPLRPDFRNGYAGRVRPVYAKPATAKPATAKPAAAKPAAKPKAGPIQWKVKAGDTLARIQAYYNGPSVNTIAKHNGITNVNRIEVGDVLSIPGRLEWVVTRGDTLSKIAKYYAVSVGYLAKLNGIKDVNRIEIGDVIRIQ